MDHYRLARLTDPTSRGVANLLRAIRDDLLPAGRDEGAVLWGVFGGLFGLATNEVYLMTAGKEPPPPLADSAGLTVSDQFDLVPTVRPAAISPPEKPGLYVYRWFQVRNRDVDEIAAMSQQAWVTFEDSFDSEVQGLFAGRDRTEEVGIMLLVTWYRNLSVWEESRSPPQAARDLFVRRHSLTLRATPIATRLLPLT